MWSITLFFSVETRGVACQSAAPTRLDVVVRLSERGAVDQGGGDDHAVALSTVEVLNGAGGG